MALQAHGTITLTNSQPTEIVLILEPWADEYLVREGASVLVNFDGPEDIRLQIVTQPGRIALYGWEGSVLTVQLDVSN
jgi:hypothetical protein